MERGDYTFESPLVRLRLVDADYRGDYGFKLPGDDVELVSSLNKLRGRQFYIFFFAGPRLAYSSIRVRSLICPSVGHKISDTELSLLGSAPDCSQLYHCSEGTFVTDICKIDGGVYKINCMMTGVVVGKTIYLLGGASGYEDGAFVNSPRALGFNITPDGLSADPDSYLISPMHSDKGESSIAVEHNGILFVLSDFYQHEPEYTFESYNIKENKWCVLDSPPFHKMVLSSNGIICSYALIDNKIYVSTRRGAYLYDIFGKKWEACHLFDGAPRFRDVFWDGEHLSDESDDEEIKGGVPFGFDGEGMLFENDFLIGMLRSLGLVVAYWINSRRVKQKQILCRLPEPNYFDGLASLVKLDEGYFCVTYYKHIEKTKLVILVFHISRLEEFSDERFLHSRICCRHEIEVQSEDKASRPFCFAV